MMNLSNQALQLATTDIDNSTNLKPVKPAIYQEPSTLVIIIITIISSSSNLLLFNLYYY